MKEHDAKIAARLPLKTLNQIDDLVKSGKNRNRSEVIRRALNKFLNSKEEKS